MADRSTKQVHQRELAGRSEDRQEAATNFLFFSHRIERRHGQIDIATQRGASEFRVFLLRPTDPALSLGVTDTPTTAV